MNGILPAGVSWARDRRKRTLRVHWDQQVSQVPSDTSLNLRTHGTNDDNVPEPAQRTEPRTRTSIRRSDRRIVLEMYTKNQILKFFFLLPFGLESECN